MAAQYAGSPDFEGTLSFVVSNGELNGETFVEEEYTWPLSGTLWNRSRYNAIRMTDVGDRLKLVRVFDTPDPTCIEVFSPDERSMGYVPAVLKNDPAFPNFLGRPGWFLVSTLLVERAASMNDWSIVATTWRHMNN
jgi:hypothetical protein